MTTEIEPRSSATSEEPPVPGDLVTVLTTQHDRARALLADLRESVAIVAELTEHMAGPFRELVELLATHEAAEETVVYPRLKTELQEGRLAAQCMAEEHEVKQLLAKLEKMAPAFFDFPEAMARFEDKLVAHAEHEERAVFPILEDRVPPAERHELAGDFLYAAARAPSHAHAHSPESAFGNAILGPVLATIDRVRDATHHEPRARDRRP
ncbi:MAG: hemerythrin domain-containing protein [Actinomycetota bacterium]|jgi:hemerythrin-like domain-containing protein